MSYSKLSREEKNRRNRRSRELYAKKRREREKRSLASKKGWETRRAKQVEIRRLTEEVARLKAEKEESDRELAELRKIADQVGQGRRELSDLFFKEESGDERHQRMLVLWRESEGLASGRGVSRYGQLLLWIERNGFNQKEFWEEYRRRKGR